jgi:hypothetical protein
LAGFACSSALQDRSHTSHDNYGTYLRAGFAALSVAPASLCSSRAFSAGQFEYNGVKHKCLSTSPTALHGKSHGAFISHVSMARLPHQLGHGAFEFAVIHGIAALTPLSVPSPFSRA